VTNFHADPPIPVPNVLVGEPGKAPSPALPYLFLFARLREVAREHGYTLALHGSLNRDCDLIAVPWEEGCSDVETLVQALAEAGELYRVPGRSDPTPRAHGRLCFALFPGGKEYIDLSVMPPRVAP